jgi:serine/threonine protein kinase
LNYNQRFHVESPFTNFLRYLPEDRKPIDAETVGIIERCFGNWLSGIFSVEGAVSLLEAASDHVHRSTAYRIRSVHGLLLNGSLEQDDSVDADLVRAFDIHTLAPKIIKFSDTAHIDHQIFLKLGLTADEAIERYIVPARLITDVGGKQAIVMPAYANSLSVVRSNNQEKDDAIVLMPAILRGVVQIRTALLTLHSAGIIHNDIKPGNILLDFSGNWHLCDLGSCTCTGIRLEKDAKFSEYYAPSDFHNLSAKVRRNTRAYDHLLLAVVALDRLELLDLRNRFTSNQLIDSVSKVTHVELAALLRELIACLL